MALQYSQAMTPGAPRREEQTGSQLAVHHQIRNDRCVPTNVELLACGGFEICIDNC